MAKELSASSARDELAPTRETLLERLRNLDDRASWQEFFDTYWKLLYCAALKSGLSDQEAEDVVQETIIGVARNMENFRYEPENCSFKGWLMHIARRRIIDRLRKRQTRPREFLPVPADTASTNAGPQLVDTAAERAFESVWEAEWEKNLIDAAMERVKHTVKPEHYQIFYLHSVKDLPARQIAGLLHITTAKVYVVQHRVARLVRSQVEVLKRESEERIKGERSAAET